MDPSDRNDAPGYTDAHSQHSTTSTLLDAEQGRELIVPFIMIWDSRKRIIIETSSGHSYVSLEAARALFLQAKPMEKVWSGNL